MAETMRDDSAGFLRLCREREALAEKYKEHTIAMQAALEAEELEAALKALAERDALIQAIDALEPELLALAPTAGQGDAALDAVVLRTRETFLSVQETDRRNRESLRALMRQTGEESRKLVQSRKGIGSYGQKDLIVSPGFFDELK